MYHGKSATMGSIVHHKSNRPNEASIGSTQTPFLMDQNTNPNLKLELNFVIFKRKNFVWLTAVFNESIFIRARLIYHFLDTIADVFQR